MLALICGAIWAGLVCYLLSRAIRQFRDYQQATISAPSRLDDLPNVSIIVPVRNEIANIGLCLAGLTEQTGLGSGTRIIVIDDSSQDGTRVVVERYIKANPRISLHDAGPLPTGWAGKPHACWRGALLASSDWLCFIDADVRAGPELIGAALTTAAEQGIDMLSLHPRQELGSFWEWVVIPAGLLVLACAKPFEPSSQDIVNGQFLLIRREAYFAVGGHSQVCAEICEDKALATRLRSQGLRLQVLAAPQLASTRMYRDLHSLWEGFAKNSAEVLGSVPATLTAALSTLVFAWTALLLPVATLSAVFAAPSLAAVTGAILAVFGTLIVAGVHFGTARHFRIPVVFSLTFTLGYTVVACLACHGVITQLTGRVTWKGRTYQLTKTSTGRV